VNKSLLLGDLLALFLTTFIGFVTHGESVIAVFPRFLAVFIPLTLAWFLLALWFRLFQQEITSNPKQLWRPVFAMVFAVPFAAVLRSLVLNTAILPIFVIVLVATSAFGMLLWRGLYFLIARKA